MIEDDPLTHDLSVSLRHLRLFESVARLQSVGRASEECHLSQPAVTQAIARLEEQVGVALLERRASGSYLNEFGTIFYRRTQRLFDQIERALVELGVPDDRTPIQIIASRLTRSQIRSLNAIVDQGSFAQAARALGVTHTSLQRAARNLERILRTPLYIQTAFGVVATPAGAEFSRKLKLATQELDSAIDELEAARGNAGGEIVIGAILLTGSATLASILHELAASYPNVGIRLLGGSAEDMMASLHRGDVDFLLGLLRDPTPEGLVGKPLAETPYVIAARRGHPLTRKSKVTFDDLYHYEWIVGTPGARRRSHFEKLFEKREPPKIRFSIGPLGIIRNLMVDNDYLTLLTSYQLLQEDDALTTLPFEPIEPVPLIGLTIRDNWLPTQIQATFMELVEKRIVGLMTTAKEFKRAS